jgi:hypothetical protein
MVVSNLIKLRGGDRNGFTLTAAFFLFSSIKNIFLIKKRGFLEIL